MPFTELFDALDRLDSRAWAAQLAPDVVMRFANEDPVHGREACIAAANSLVASVTSISHEVIEHWEHGEATIVEAAVTFGLAGKDDVTLPMVTTYRTLPSGLIGDYRVYLDPRPLWG